MRLFFTMWLFVACCFLFGNNQALAQDDDLVIFDDDFTRSVQIDSIIAVPFKNIIPTDAAATFVVNCVAIVDEAIVRDLDLCCTANPIIPILNREADDTCL